MDYQAGSCKSQVIRNDVSLFVYLLTFFSLVFPFTLFAQTTTNPLTTDITITAVVLAAPVPIPSPYYPPQGPINMVDATDVVVFRGLAYPGSVVSILKNGSIVAEDPANPDGTFEVRVKKIAPGTYSFGVRAEDSDRIKSKLTLLTVFVSSGVVTIVDGIFIPPTITTDKIEVKKGDVITFMGRTAPESLIRLLVRSFSGSEFIKQASSTTEGKWRFVYDTSLLSEIGRASCRERV